MNPVNNFHMFFSLNNYVLLIFIIFLQQNINVNVQPSPISIVPKIMDTTYVFFCVLSFLCKEWSALLVIKLAYLINGIIVC